MARNPPALIEQTEPKLKARTRATSLCIEERCAMNSGRAWARQFITLRGRAVTTKHAEAEGAIVAEQPGIYVLVGL
jgi:hypothetical protein